MSRGHAKRLGQMAAQQLRDSGRSGRVAGGQQSQGKKGPPPAITLPPIKRHPDKFVGWWQSKAPGSPWKVICRGETYMGCFDLLLRLLAALNLHGGRSEVLPAGERPGEPDKT